MGSAGFRRHNGETACPDRAIRKPRGARAAEPRETVLSPVVGPRVPPDEGECAASMDLPCRRVKQNAHPYG